MKKFIVIICLAVSVLPLSAQELGFIGGGSLNHGMIIMKNHAVDFNPTLRGGFQVGLMYEMNLGKRWGFDAAVEYSLRRSHFNIISAEYESADTSTLMNRRLNYLDIPIHIYYDLPINEYYMFSFFGGPYTSIGMDGKDVGWYNIDTQKPKFLETSDVFGKDAGRVARMEIGLDLGCGLKFGNYQVRASYQINFNNDNINSYNWSIEDLPDGIGRYYMQGAFKLSFAYLFNLKRKY